MRARQAPDRIGMLVLHPLEQGTAVMQPDAHRGMRLQRGDEGRVGVRPDVLDDPAEIADRLMVVEDQAERDPRRHGVHLAGLVSRRGPRTGAPVAAVDDPSGSLLTSANPFAKPVCCMIHGPVSDERAWTWRSRSGGPAVRTWPRAAGVSKTSVSFAFNKPERLKPATAVRILEIAQSMGYRPHPVARMLTTAPHRARWAS